MFYILLYYFQGTKWTEKIEELLRDFSTNMWQKEAQIKEL